MGRLASLPDTAAGDTENRRIAVLNKKRLANHPYRTWITNVDPRIEVSLFAQDDEDSRAYFSDGDHGYAHVSLYRSWKQNRLPDADIVELHRHRPFDRVVALSECDVVRAGELRSALGLPGLTATASRAFRDKVLMKELAVRSGLAVPAFAPVQDVWDVVDFADAHPGPLVIKPVDGAGAVGVEVLNDKDALRSWARAQRQVRDEPMRLMVESYVDAPMVTVDGIMAAGEVVSAMANSYFGTCLDAVASQQAVALLQLDTASGPGRRALEYASRLLSALPSPAEPTSFHLELFDAQPGPLLCEVAARTGGGRINELAMHALGIDLEQWSCLGQAGLDPRVTADAPRRAHDFVGFVLLPRHRGCLERFPADCPVGGVIDYRTHYQAGDRLTPNAKVSDCVADALFVAPDTSALRSVCSEVVDWYEQTFEWST